MRKVIILEVIVILFTLAIAGFESVFWLYNQTTVSQQNQSLQTSQEDLLFWNLKSKQVVSGLFNYSGGNGTTSFEVDNPKGVPILNSVIVAHHGKFAFTAGTNGQYNLYVHNDEMQSNWLDYEYSISSPILGFDPATFISLVLTIGIVLALIVAFVNSYLIRSKKSGLQTKITLYFRLQLWKSFAELPQEHP